MKKSVVLFVRAWKQLKMAVVIMVKDISAKIAKEDLDWKTISILEKQRISGRNTFLGNKLSENYVEYFHIQKSNYRGYLRLI